MIEDVAVDDKLADVAVIFCTDHDLVVGSHKNGVFEGVPHPAVLVLEANAVGRNQAFSVRTENALAPVFDVHDLEGIYVNMEDVRCSPCGEDPIIGGSHLAGKVDAFRIVNLVIDIEAKRGPRSKGRVGLAEPWAVGRKWLGKWQKIR